MSWSGPAQLQIGLSIRQRPPLIISLSSGNVLIFSPKLLRSPRTSSRSRRSVDFLSPIKVETQPTARPPLLSPPRQTFPIHLLPPSSSRLVRFYFPVSSSSRIAAPPIAVSTDFIVIDNVFRVLFDSRSSLTNTATSRSTSCKLNSIPFPRELLQFL